MTPNETEQLLTEAAQLFQAGQFNDAEAACTRLLERTPEQPQALQLLGFIHFGKQQPDIAIDYLVRATQAAPDNIETHFNLARAYEEMADIERAVSSYRAAHACAPDDLDVLSALGRTLARQGRFVDAEECFNQTVTLSPYSAACHANLANVLSNQHRYEEAEASYREALKIDSQLAPAHNGLGQAQLGQGKFDDALVSIKQSLALNPDFVDAHVSLGNTLKATGNIAGALQSYREALKRAPDNADAHFNLSLALFLSGDIAEGWQEYEWRWQWKFMASPKRNLPQPAWQKESLLKTSVVVWGEQGIGDEIMFASLLPDLIEEASSVTVECEPRLLPIYKRSFPDIDLIPKKATPDSKLLEKTADFQIAIGSLGRRYRPSINAFPKHDGYLKADTEKIRSFSEQYRARFPGKQLIGISWKSGNEELGAMRSAMLDTWQPVFKHADCAFINVQYGDVHAELGNISQQTGVEIYADQAVDPLTDMDTFAAQLAALDLIISIDNSTVHLAGAMGLPTWTLLPTTPDWRWMLETSISHWYPAMQLFRQQTIGVWDDVFHQVSKALENN